MENSWLVGNICAERGVEYKEEAVTVDKLQGLQIRQGGGLVRDQSGPPFFIACKRCYINVYRAFFFRNTSYTKPRILRNAHGLLTRFFPVLFQKHLLNRNFHLVRGEHMFLR